MKQHRTCWHARRLRQIGKHSCQRGQKRFTPRRNMPTPHPTSRWSVLRALQAAARAKACMCGSAGPCPNKSLERTGLRGEQSSTATILRQVEKTAARAPECCGPDVRVGICLSRTYRVSGSLVARYHVSTCAYTPSAHTCTDTSGTCAAHGLLIIGVRVSYAYIHST